MNQESESLEARRERIATALLNGFIGAALLAKVQVCEDCAADVAVEFADALINRLADGPVDWHHEAHRLDA